MNQPIIPNKTIWSELWARAQREPLGLLCRFSDNSTARWNLHVHRPRHLEGYTVSLIRDPDVIIITGPNANPPQDHRIHALREVMSDLTIDDVIDSATEALE